MTEAISMGLLLLEASEENLGAQLEHSVGMEGPMVLSYRACFLKAMESNSVMKLSFPAL